MSARFAVLLIGPGPRHLIAALEVSAHGPFDVLLADDATAARAICQERSVEALVADRASAEEAFSCCAEARVAATIVIDPDVDALVSWARRGATDVLAPNDLDGPAAGRRVRAAIERKRVELGARAGYATDPATGLPHRQQLVEHLSQLLALRDREPAPMAVLALRLEGFATTEARLGTPASDALRRKVAVRIRAAVRASDVVATLDDASFAVMLGSLLAPADAERVGAKLIQLLIEPFSVGGVQVAVAVAIGIAHYPEDGNQPDTLLRKAIGMALDTPARGRVGMANFEEGGSFAASAANDD